MLGTREVSYYEMKVREKHRLTCLPRVQVFSCLEVLQITVVSKDLKGMLASSPVVPKLGGVPPYCGGGGHTNGIALGAK